MNQTDNNAINTKNKPVSGLYIVSTPIGNLQDITLRAIETLKGSDIIVCEDTRVANKLLSNLGIKKTLLIYNDHSTEKDRQSIIRHLHDNKIVSLISDAGTPLISDPGYKLIRVARSEGIYITAIPGPCSPIMALTLSGLPCDRFFFEGFLPKKKEALKKRLEELSVIGASIVVLERSDRIASVLECISEVLGGRKVSVARELTKKFEEVKTDTAKNLLSYYIENPPLGEAVMVIAPADSSEVVLDTSSLEKELSTYMKKMSVKDAVELVSQKTGINKKALYKEALKLKNE